MDNSIDIFRQYRNLKANNLIIRAGINTQSYYNARSGSKNISFDIINKLDTALNLNGFLHVAHLFDRLHHLGIKIPIDDFSIPDRYNDLGRLLLQKHPIFNDNTLNIIEYSEKNKNN